MINKRHAEKLIKTGRMSAHGLEQVAIAQQNGQWDAAYYGSKEFELQEDFLAALEGHPVAKEFLQTLDRTNQHAIYLRLQSVVKPAVRAKRLEAILEKLDRHERLER
ncbi:MAG: YdeI/OmpD-associated family protein [Paracoccaceae bacterium]|nr:YdeI/OmpD-associated family protein [Paracoccaceae bacterium]